MQAILLRKYNQGSTEGILVFMDGGKIVYNCNTLELPNKDNQFRISCIPEGVYQVAPHISPKFGKCFEVKEVQNRTAILFHAGNTVKDTHGCVLVGIYKSIGFVADSRKTLKKILEIAPKGFELHIMDFT